jgi:hypothetical protein
MSSLFSPKISTKNNNMNYPLDQKFNEYTQNSLNNVNIVNKDIINISVNTSNKMTDSKN